MYAEENANIEFVEHTGNSSLLHEDDVWLYRSQFDLSETKYVGGQRRFEALEGIERLFEKARDSTKIGNRSFKISRFSESHAFLFRYLTEGHKPRRGKISKNSRYGMFRTKTKEVM